MTFKFYSSDSSRSPDGKSTLPRPDNGAAVIVILMMSLVFVPIVAAHVAVLWHHHMQGSGAQQIASLISLLLHPVTGAN